ncbi:nodulation protein NfeD [Variovorax sp. J22R133]|uniref:NfeD family protein n=1 Tax=Variovorax brevis TaxID=3053503 RepID=UPI002574D0DA|nr:nodulation protein NfeD [Variovorax sp. J22R133]MDM0114747.1 nodulation protein NfeD [Variovorax sp. J22R133]
MLPRPPRAWLICALVLLGFFSRMASCGAATGDAAPPVFVIPIQGAIGPATADQIKRALERAAREHAQLVVLQLDTPGGLDTAMRSIVQNILASPVPVAGYVAPQGARAASAGTYMLYACHVAAMAPATNLGAATPVAIGMPTPGAQPSAQPPGSASKPDKSEDTMSAKRINDATAYIRSLAQLRGRNVEWAEQAVRESVSLPANEALSRKVIDVVATDRDDLLRQLDGRSLKLGAAGAAPVKLSTAHAPVVVLEADWRDKLLAAISDPGIALVLLMIGVYGLMFEFMNPGFVAPGVIGGLCLLLAMWALQMLPINYVGLGLILLGIVFFVAEAFVPSYGALGIGGVAAFGLGALLLIDSDVPGFGVPLHLIGALMAVSAVFVIGVARMAVKARSRPVRSGMQRFIGASAEVIEFADGEGWALIDGERWRIRSTHALRAGENVRIARADGITLEVNAVSATRSTTQEARTT